MAPNRRNDILSCLNTFKHLANIPHFQPLGNGTLKNAKSVDVSKLSEDSVLVVRKVRSMDGKALGLIEMAVPFDFLTAPDFNLGAYLARHLMDAEWAMLEQRARDLAEEECPF